MYKLVIRPYALKLSGTAYEWYEQRLHGLGEKFLLVLDKAYDKLIQNPFIGSEVRNGIRQLSLGRFPYVVLYRIHKNTVVIVNVFHTSQNPKKKFKS